MPRKTYAVCRFCEAPLRNAGDEICDDCVRAEEETALEEAKAEEALRIRRESDERYEREYWESVRQEMWNEHFRQEDAEVVSGIEEAHWHFADRDDARGE